MLGHLQTLALSVVLATSLARAIEFSQDAYELSFDENLAPQAIGIVDVISSSSSPTFVVLSGPSVGTVSINEQTGELTLAQPVLTGDLARGYISFIVSATDSTGSAQALIVASIVPQTCRSAVRQIQSVSMGLNGPTCAASTSGQYWCWGECRANSNACGYGSESTVADERISVNRRLSDAELLPAIDIPDGMQVAEAVSTKGNDAGNSVATCVRLTSGGLRCYGGARLLPYSSPADTLEDAPSAPAALGTASLAAATFTNVWAGSSHFCAAFETAAATSDPASTASVDLACWGSNVHGELGYVSASVQPRSLQAVLPDLGSPTATPFLSSLSAASRRNKVALGNRVTCIGHDASFGVRCAGRRIVGDGSYSGFEQVPLPFDDVFTVAIDAAERRVCAAMGHPGADGEPKTFVKCMGSWTAADGSEVESASDSLDFVYTGIESRTPKSIAVVPGGFCVVLEGDTKDDVVCSVDSVFGDADLSDPDAAEYEASYQAALAGTANLRMVIKSSTPLALVDSGERPTHVESADLDGNGHPDYLIGYASDAETPARTGRIEVFLATDSGTGFHPKFTVGQDTPGWPSTIPTDSNRFGYSIVAHDMNGDGQLDLLIGQPRYQQSSPVRGNAGAVILVQVASVSPAGFVLQRVELLTEGSLDQDSTRYLEVQGQMGSSIVPLGSMGFSNSQSFLIGERGQGDINYFRLEFNGASGATRVLQRTELRDRTTLCINPQFGSSAALARIDTDGSALVDVAKPFDCILDQSRSTFIREGTIQRVRITPQGGMSIVRSTITAVSPEIIHMYQQLPDGSGMVLGKKNMVSPGDLDGDGVNDLIAPAPAFRQPGETTTTGALVIMYMTAIGDVREAHEVSRRTLGLTAGFTMETGTIAAVVGEPLSAGDGRTTLKLVVGGASTGSATAVSGDDQLTLLELQRTPVSRELDLSAHASLQLTSSTEAQTTSVTSITGAGCSFCATYDTNTAQNALRCWGCDGGAYRFSGRSVAGSLGYGELDGPVGSTAGAARVPYNYGPHAFAGCESKDGPDVSVASAGSVSDGMPVGTSVLAVSVSSDASPSVELVGIDAGFLTYYTYNPASSRIETAATIDYEGMQALGAIELRGAVIVHDDDGVTTKPITISVTNVIEPPVLDDSISPIAAANVQGSATPSTVLTATVVSVDFATQSTTLQIVSVGGALENPEQFFGTEQSGADFSSQSVNLLDSSLPAGTYDLELRAMTTMTDGSVEVSQEVIELQFTVQCGPGSIPDADGACQACAPGFFKSDFTATECDVCPSNSFQPASGSAECLACATLQLDQKWFSHSEAGQTEECPVCDVSAQPTADRSGCICRSGLIPSVEGASGSDLVCVSSGAIRFIWGDFNLTREEPVTLNEYPDLTQDVLRWPNTRFGWEVPGARHAARIGHVIVEPLDAVDVAGVLRDEGGGFGATPTISVESTSAVSVFLLGELQTYWLHSDLSTAAGQRLGRQDFEELNGLGVGGTATFRYRLSVYDGSEFSPCHPDRLGTTICTSSPASRVVTLGVTEVADRPGIRVAGSEFEVPENAPAGTRLSVASGTAFADPPAPRPNLAASLTDGNDDLVAHVTAGAPIDSQDATVAVTVAVVSGQSMSVTLDADGFLVTTAPMDFDVRASPESTVRITARATAPGKPIVEVSRDVILRITDVNEAPVEISAGGVVSILENQPANAVLDGGALSLGADNNDVTFVCAVTSPATQFEARAGAAATASTYNSAANFDLVALQTFDFEPATWPTQIDLQCTATYSDGSTQVLSLSRSFAVRNLNEEPSVAIIGSTVVQVPERSQGIKISAVRATDPDVGATFSFSLRAVTAAEAAAAGLSSFDAQRASSDAATFELSGSSPSEKDINLVADAQLDFESGVIELYVAIDVDDGQLDGEITRRRALNGRRLLQDTAILTVQVLDIDDQPTVDPAAGASTFKETTPFETKSTSVPVVQDEDTLPANTLYSVAIVSGDAQGRFEASLSAAGEIAVTPKAGASFDFESEAAEFDLVLQLTDDQFSIEVPYTMTMLDAAEAPLLAQDVTQTSIDENTAGPITIATFVAQGVDAIDSSFDLDQFSVDCTSNTEPPTSVTGNVEGSLGNDGEFILSYVGSGEDFESDDSHSGFSCAVSVTGNGIPNLGGPSDGSSPGVASQSLIVEVSINNVNEAPVLSDQTFAFEMAENTVDLMALLPITVTDVDSAYDPAQNTQSWSLSGPDAGLFSIIGGFNGAELQYNGPAQDFEADVLNIQPTLELLVTATDTGRLSVSAGIVVTILDVNEAPTVDAPPATGELWNIVATSPVGTIATGRVFIPSDPDADSAPFLEISACTGVACESISFNPISHQLEVSGPLPSGAIFPASLSLEIRARDSAASSALVSDAYAMDVLIGCGASCPDVSTIAVGACSADGSVVQTCYNPSDLGLPGGDDGEVVLEDSTVNSAAPHAPDGTLAVVDAETSALGPRPRSDDCVVTVKAAWATESVVATAVEPMRIFRLSAPAGTRGGGSAIVAHFALLSGETKTLSIPALADGEASSLRLQSLNPVAVCSQSSGITGLADLPESCWLVASASSSVDVASRCFCESCGEADPEAPSTFKNPVCADDSLEALGIPASTSCLACTVCSATEYETRSCRATHPDDTAVTTDAIYANRQCNECAECAYNEYQLVDCTEGGNERQNRVCEGRLADGYPQRVLDGQGGSRGRISEVYSDGKRNADCVVEVDTKYSDFRAGTDVDEVQAWFMLTETNERFNYVFQMTNHRQYRQLLGKFRRSKLTVRLFYLHLNRGEEQPTERPDESDPRWRQSGSVAIQGACLVNYDAAENLPGWPQRSVREASNGAIEHVLDLEQRDENCNALMSVRYVCRDRGDGSSCASSRTFLLRETKHNAYAATVTLDSGTETVVNAGTFRQSKLEFSLYTPDGDGGWERPKTIRFGNTCVQYPPAAAVVEGGLHTNSRTGTRGWLQGEYGERRAANGDVIVRVRYFDQHGPDSVTYEIRETKHRALRQSVVVQNGEEKVLNLGQFRQSKLTFGLFRERTVGRHNWLQQRTINIGNLRIETFDEAQLVAGTSRNTRRTGRRGGIWGIYGERRSPSCRVQFEVGFYQPWGCEDEERTFVIRELKHRKYSSQITLRNGESALVDAGLFSNSKLEFGLHVNDLKGNWVLWSSRPRVAYFGNECADLFDAADNSDDIDTIQNRGGRYDVNTGTNGRIMTVWGDKRAGASSGLVTVSGLTGATNGAEEGDAIFRVAYRNTLGTDSRRLLIRETRHNRFQRAITLESGTEAWVNAGQFSNSKLTFTLFWHDDARGWLQGESISLGNERVQFLEDAQQAAGYPIENYRYTGRDARLETITGSERLCDGSIGFRVLYCEDERYAPATRTFALFETRHRVYAAQIEVPNCQETVVLVPALAIASKSKVRFELARSDGEGDWDTIGRNTVDLQNDRNADVCPSHLDLPVPSAGSRRVQSVRGSSSSIGFSLSQGGMSASTRVLLADTAVATVDIDTASVVASSAALEVLEASGSASAAALEAIRADVQAGARASLAVSNPELAAQVAVFVNADYASSELGIAVFPADAEAAVLSALGGSGGVVPAISAASGPQLQAALAAGATVEAESEMTIGSPSAEAALETDEIGETDSTSNGNAESSDEAEADAGSTSGAAILSPTIALGVAGGAIVLAIAAIAVAAVISVRSKVATRAPGTAPASEGRYLEAGGSLRKHRSIDLSGSPAKLQSDSDSGLQMAAAASSGSDSDTQ